MAQIGSESQVSVRTRLMDIRNRLEQRMFSDWKNARVLLRELEGIGDGHPSGCPSPDKLLGVIRLFRAEKFRVVREGGSEMSAVDDIQFAISELKNIAIAAKKARPIIIHSPWWERYSPLPGILLVCVSLVFSLAITYVSLSYSSIIYLSLSFIAVVFIFGVLSRSEKGVIVSVSIIMFSVLNIISR
ncbi:hypothetical protein J1782_07145 [Rahnella sp. BCC 1045]|uniref:hypothetical protein n=1 Tax=Rahnella sp. BCC 1045 TaxID=2816251 RepID=UPI001C27FC11|nr:hypothetical protein [Rahnella sp. BCC 1045]MBU9819661.1 hypothetical protein [Rahnella sp. BCC 1045]